MNTRLKIPKLSKAQRNPMTPNCPGREIFTHITSRWALLILIALKDEALRFHALRDRVRGISEKMLSQTLKVLVRDGLVSRYVEHTVPPQVTYELTEMGQELSPQFHQLVAWMGRRVPDILKAQAQHDRLERGH